MTRIGYVTQDQVSPSNMLVLVDFKRMERLRFAGMECIFVKRRLIASNIMILIQNIELQKWLLVEKLKNLVVSAVRMT